LRLRDLIFAGEIGEQQAIGFEQHARTVGSTVRLSIGCWIMKYLPFDGFLS
jgi:hypothetical protein